MKRIRLFFMIIFMFGITLIMTGCTCDPAAHMWNVISFEKNTVYLNGVEQMEVYNEAYFSEPFGGMEEGIVSIVFKEDATVTFKPGTGELLTGTFTTKNNGMKDTTFSVILNNGESFSGTAVSYYYGVSLDFEFRGMSYEFEEVYESAESLHEKDLERLIVSLRNYVEKNELAKGEITFVDGNFILTINGEKLPRTLDKTVAVQCVRLDSDNKLTLLDGLEMGECFYVTDKSYGGMDRIVIYYIEPLPGEIPPEPEYTYLHEFESWMSSELMPEKVVEIKTVFEYVGVAPGEFKLIKRTTDKNVIEQILKDYECITMNRITKEESQISGGNAFTIEFILADGTVRILHFNNQNYVYKRYPNDFTTFEYFKLDSVPSLVGYTEVSDSFGFVLYKSKGKVYCEGDFLCEIPLDEIEFTELTENFDSAVAEKCYVETEFGLLNFFSDTVFYIQFPTLGRTDYYRLVEKNIDDLIAEYSID